MDGGDNYGHGNVTAERSSTVAGRVEYGAIDGGGLETEVRFGGGFRLGHGGGGMRTWLRHSAVVLAMV